MTEPDPKLVITLHSAVAPAEPRLSPEEEVIQYLRERDAPCPVCQYNLRNLTAARCPECGREVRLTIGTTEPFMRAWITLAFAAFGTASIGGLILMACIFTRDLPPSRLWPMLGYLAIGGPIAAIFTVRYRKQFVKKPQSWQWAIAIALLIASVTAIALWIWIV